MHVAIVREMRSLTKFRLGNVKGKGDLEDLGLNGLGRSRFKWEYTD